MQSNHLPRRDFLAYGSASLAGLTVLRSSLARAFPNRPGEEVVPWADPPPPVPDAASRDVQNLQKWEDLNTWLTPNERFFSISHYDRPVIDEKTWSLEIGGSIGHPLRLTLDDLKARPRREITFTLECSGNHGFPWFTAAVGNAQWAGTPLAPLLEEAQVRSSAKEVVFFGTDAGEEQVRTVKVRQNFARSMSLADAMSRDNILAYEMNGAPLPQPNGFPLRLIAPGWYGIANVKWLARIEVRDTPFMGRFHGARLCHPAGGAARGQDGGHRDLGRADLAQVGAGQGDPSGRSVPHHRRGLGRAHRQGGGPDRWRPVDSRHHRPQRGG